MGSESLLPDNTTDSRLPPELECIIFEVCALKYPTSIPSLIRVAWRVKHWVEPSLYRTICLTDAYTRNPGPRCSPEVLSSAMERLPPSFFRNNVRNMYVQYSIDPAQAHTIFETCSEVTNLALRTRLSLHDVPVLLNLPIRRLTACIGWLFHKLPLDFTMPFLRSITHLTLDDTTSSYPRVEWQKIVVDIPHLTHLALHSKLLADILFPVLLTCARLECVLFVGHARTHPRARTVDMRFVVATTSDIVEDWQASACGGADHWTRAEAILAARRARRGQ
ncbi:hypothetical protein C8R43DRAFT_994251 [Mycena crocata]|nr:hypothetical protein C8R43DRAFT_994251 [Mycena crocata]